MIDRVGETVFVCLTACQVIFDRAHSAQKQSLHGATPVKVDGRLAQKHSLAIAMTLVDPRGMPLAYDHRCSTTVEVYCNSRSHLTGSHCDSWQNSMINSLEN